MATNKDKPGTVRCVYVLEVDLADRIAEFQNTIGLPSEAEAARVLLQRALNHEDTYELIAERFKAALLRGKSLRQAAACTLGGHCLVRSIEFGDRHVSFRLTTGEAVTVHADGEWSVVISGGPALVEAFDAA